MPYITQGDRDALDAGMRTPDTAGELNYMITRLLCRYVEKEGISYARINDCIGACEGAKLEFYRRLAAPYEDTKIAQNGDVLTYAVKR